jgi:hypothetical protein
MAILGPSGNVYGGGIPNFATGGDEIIFGKQTIDNSGNVTLVLWSWQDALSTFNIIHTAGPQAGTGNLGVSYVSGDFTTIFLDGANTPIQPQPCYAFGYTMIWTGSALTVNGLYPDPYAPATAFYSLSGASPQPSICLTHQNRILYLNNTNYSWYPGTNYYFNQGAEWFNFSDPPGGINGFGQRETFVAENPYGHGAWGSVSSGELFLVRHHGGGYIVSGDLNNPSVTRLFGVQPTFGVVQQAAQTTMGIVYCSGNNGAWSWGGGSTSTKFSHQLNDDFFDPGQPTHLGSPLPTYGPRFNIVQMGEQIFFPNNYVYDIHTNGWWRLDSPSAPTYSFFAVSYDGKALWAMPKQILAGNLGIFYRYDQTAPATFYAWQSWPIPVTREKSINLREIVVRGQGVGTISFAAYGRNGSSDASVPSVATFNSTTQPQVFRLDLGLYDAQDVTIQVNSTGTGGNPAPILWDFSVGYTEANMQSAT